MVRFVKDRLIRLGIPLVFYSFILSPVLIYLVYYFGEGHRISFIQFLSGFHDWIDFGVLWFVAALLLFTLVYVLEVLRAVSYWLRQSLLFPGSGKSFEENGKTGRICY